MMDIVWAIGFDNALSAISFFVCIFLLFVSFRIAITELLKTMATHNAVKRKESCPESCMFL